MIDPISAPPIAPDNDTVRARWPSHAVATLPSDLSVAAARIRSLARLIPSITREASAIVALLTDVDAHLRNINSNPILQLTNLLQLSNLVAASSSNGPHR